jgi:polysaccharide biosynthesis/export protein
MKPLPLALWLVASALAACSALPAEGPTATELVAEAKAGGRIRFDLVKVDSWVIRILCAKRKPRFTAFFGSAGPPPKLEIAVGDTLAVTIWEAGTGGLFTLGRNDLGAKRRHSATGGLGRIGKGSAATPGGPLAGAPFSAGSRESLGKRGFNRGRGAKEDASEQAIGIPDEVVGRDGAISIPYAGRIPVAGRSPAEVERAIERRLEGKAIAPRAIVVDRKSPANSVTVTGTAIAGARVRLSPAGDRLLEVIAAAGGAKSPLYDTVLRLSRGGVTATVPLATLVAHPAQDIYAEPGDVLTLFRVPRRLSVAGAAGGQGLIPFDSAHPTLIEALGKAHGLADARADPKGVFLFRYERDDVVRALGASVVDVAAEGVTPVVYRLDLGDAQSYALARRFPVRDEDFILVTEAKTRLLSKLFRLFQRVTGPFVNSILVCGETTC